MSAETRPDESGRERILRDIALWQADGLISPATAATVRERYGVQRAGLAELLRYVGIVGLIFVVCGILGLMGSIAASEVLGGFLLLGVGCGFGAAGITFAHDRLGRYSWSSRVALTIAAVAVTVAVALLLDAAHVAGNRVVFFAGWIVIPVVFVVAYRYRITFLLVICLIEFFHWAGSWTTMWGHAEYEISIQDPKVMAAVALAVVGVGLWHERALADKTGRFFAAYESMGLVYLNLSLLILSLYPPHAARLWAVAMTVAALGQILLGARIRNHLILGFGVTFAFIDGFTRFYETFWDSRTKAAFFLGIGLITFCVGAACEAALRSQTRAAR